MFFTLSIVIVIYDCEKHLWVSHKFLQVFSCTQHFKFFMHLSFYGLVSLLTLGYRFSKHHFFLHSSFESHLKIVATHKFNNCREHLVAFAKPHTLITCPHSTVIKFLLHIRVIVHINVFSGRGIVGLLLKPITCLVFTISN